MRAKLTVLCENTVGKPVQAIGEHGFACMVEKAGGRFLFDTGQGLGLAHNADLLNVDLQPLDGIILSHGHFDHGGGLLTALERSGGARVYAHPDIFSVRHWVGRYERRANGLPFRREEAEAAGACFDLKREFRAIADGLWLSGEIPANDPTRFTDPALQSETSAGALGRDQLADDQSLLIDSARGPVLLTGCAHAGLPDIIMHLQQKTGYRQIFAIIGGLHLAPADDAHFAAVVETLRKVRVQRIGVAHCTGLRRAAQLQALFPEAVFFANVGSTFDL